MQTMLYIVALNTTVLSLPGLVGSLPPGGLGGMLAVLVIVFAWLLLGSGIAWAIGRASDLGENSRGQD